MGDPAVWLRLALYLDLLLAFGVPAFVLTAPAAVGEALKFRAGLLAAGVLGVVLSGVGLLSLTAGMAGVSVWNVDRGTLASVLQGTAVGAAWIVRISSLVLLAVGAAMVRGRAGTVLAAACGAVAAATLAWSGHGAMDEGPLGALHLVADVMHVLAAGLWFGALLVLVLLVWRAGTTADETYPLMAAEALASFAATGARTVAILTASGIVNLWLVVGPAGLTDIPTTTYGRLLLAKLALFAGMLALAATHRFRYVPALEGAVDAGARQITLRRLRVTLVVEATGAGAVLALVAWLGTLEP